MNFIFLIKQHKLGAIFSVVAATLIVVAVANRLNDNGQNQTAAQLPAVALISVADYARAPAIVLDNGIAESLKQADLKAQISATIVSVNAKLGDRVAAGQVLVKLQDKDIAAQLEQALANLDALKIGARAEDLRLSQTAAENAKTALADSIKDAYAKADDAVHNHIDKFFANPRQSTAEFLILANISGAQIILRPNNDELARQIAKQKYDLEAIFSDWQKNIQTLSAASNQIQIETAAQSAKTNLQSVINLANAMAPLVNDLTSDNAAHKQVIDGYKTEFSAARGALGGAIASLQSAHTAWQTANNALELKLAGASAEQIRGAQAAADGLKATLAKTSIVAPISGTISQISANVGELATPGQLIASIVNPNALQVKTYASENDLSKINLGDTAQIDGGAAGIVSNISPAINAQTKKAEVIVAITKNAKIPIVVGQNASVKINPKNAAGGGFLLPIHAVQFTDNGNFVFIIDSRNIIQALPVQTGDLIGENIEIAGGLKSDDKIVASVRGLKEGDTIITQ